MLNNDQRCLCFCHVQRHVELALQLYCTLTDFIRVVTASSASYYPASTLAVAQVADHCSRCCSTVMTLLKSQGLRHDPAVLVFYEAEVQLLLCQQHHLQISQHSSVTPQWTSAVEMHTQDSTVIQA